MLYQYFVELNRIFLMKRVNKKTHVAIMKKSWGLLEKIVSGKKTIESRWYKNRSKPWNEIKPGEVIYFKDSGEMVKIRAKVRKVVQFENLNQEKIRWILETYGGKDGLGIDNVEKYFEMFRTKRYCILIFFEKVKKIRPFKINKKGFGAMTAWLVVDDIKKIKK